MQLQVRARPSPRQIGIALAAKTNLVAVAASLCIAAGAAAQTGGIEITEAWARATPAGAENGVAYLTIRSPTADRLTGAATPVAAKAELHQMIMADGIMKMRQPAALDLPAGHRVTLKPGGLHIMLLGLKEPLRQGQKFPLTLSFDRAGSRVVSVAVAKPGAMGLDKAGAGTAAPMHP